MDGVPKRYEVYWELSDALEEAGVDVHGSPMVQDIVNCVATQVADIFEVFAERLGESE